MFLALRNTEGEDAPTLMKLATRAGKLSWKKTQDELADEHGLAIVIVEGEDSVVVSKSNNNSICGHLYPSAEFAPRCAEYCGKAYGAATRAGKTVHFKCHADLNFLAVPINAPEKTLVAIVGRSFAKSEDYRAATERAISGDWHQFPAGEFFSNVLISSSVQDLEPLARRFEKLRDEEKEALLRLERNVEKLPEEIPGAGEISEKEVERIPPPPPAENFAKVPDAEKSNGNSASAFSGGSPTNSQGAAASPQFKNAGQITELAAWRSLLGSLLTLTYKESCSVILQFLANRYGLASLAWLEREGNSLAVALATGGLRNQQMQISIPADDKLFLEAAQMDTALEFRERQQPEGDGGGAALGDEPQTIQLFPVALGGQLRAAVIAADEIDDENVKRHIARFIRSVTSELEILRLREEIARQSALSNAVQRFNQSLNHIDGEDDWEFLARTSAEIMQAERGSLLMFDEESQEFLAKAAVGTQADIIKQERETLGYKVARKVLQRGVPLVAKNIRETEIEPAPAEWKYKTDSFISYPIIMNGKKIGVLNITDKADGTAYNEFDLRLMNTFAPQLAVALDRLALKRKAGEFMQLSITDPLTGLRNRRYLEERFAEEIKRWERNGVPVSFMMIDVDEFKAYNDAFTHLEGDKALKLVGQALKATLRGVDVAARYGGEEFSILLPQTSLSEAYTIAERIRERVESTKFPKRPVTVSIGIATCSPDLSTWERLVSAADEAVYAAKRAGKNNVKVFEKLSAAERKSTAEPDAGAGSDPSAGN